MARVQYREKNITTMSCPRCEKNLSIVKIRQDKTTQTPKQGWMILCNEDQYMLPKHVINIRKEDYNLVNSNDLISLVEYLTSRTSVFTFQTSACCFVENEWGSVHDITIVNALSTSHFLLLIITSHCMYGQRSIRRIVHTNFDPPLSELMCKSWNISRSHKLC